MLRMNAASEESGKEWQNATPRFFAALRITAGIILRTDYYVSGGFDEHAA